MTKMVKFPRTLAACQHAENAQWDIGDALIAECGPPGENGVNNGSGGKLSEAAKVIAENGLEYSFETLRIYRLVAHAFPAVTRITGVSFACHQEAGSPERLQQIVKSLPKDTRLTQKLLREILDHLVQEERAAREAKSKALDEQLAQERERRKQTIVSLKNDKLDEEAKAAAREQLKNIEEAIEKTETQRTIVTPVHRRNVPVEPRRIPESLRWLEITTNISTALTSLRRAHKMAEEHCAKLDMHSKEEVIEKCGEVIRTIDQIMDLMRNGTSAKPTSAKRKQFTVVK